MIKRYNSSKNIVSLHVFLFLIGFIAGMSFIFALLKNDLTNLENLESAIKPIFFNNKRKPRVSIFTEKNGTTQVIDTLFDSVKILCLINTFEKQIEKRAIHVNATWAKRCNKYLFLSYNENITLPYLDLGLPERRSNLWSKIRALFRWTLENEIDNFDFFLKADDDSYFIMENLRFMLLPYNPDEAYYFGSRFKYIVKHGYMSGGAGYILSREAVKQLVPHFNDSKVCPQKEEDKEDAKIGSCVENLNITSVDTRDNLGRHRMLPFSISDHLIKGLRPRHFAYLYYPYPHSSNIFNSCADYMISFHYINYELMYYFDFMLYHVKTFGIFNNLLIESLNSDIADGMTLLETLKEISYRHSSNISLIS